MKKPLLCAVLFCVALVVKAQDDTDKTAVIGLKAGMNMSILSASVNSDPSFKAGFHAGVYVKKQISKSLFFRPELYYSSQGQKDDYETTPNGPSAGSTTTTLDYLNLPLLLETGRKVNFQFGPQIGFLLSAHEKGTIDNEPVNDDLKSIMKKTDLSLVLGVGFSPAEHFNLGARCNLGLTDIFNSSGYFPEVKNRVVHFYVAVSL